MADIEILTLNEKDKWNSVLQTAGVSDFYFTPQYAELCGFNEEGESLCYVYNVGEKLYVYPFRLRNLPISVTEKIGKKFKDITSDYGYGGPISNCVDKSFITDADEKFKEFCKDNKIITEFVRFHPVLNNHGTMDECYDLIKLNPTVVAKLVEPEEMLRRFRKNFRYDIKKSFKQGLKVRIAHSENDWRMFQQIYEETMEHLAAEQFYFFPQKYYDYMAQLKENVFLLLAEYENQIVGSACFFYDKNSLHYHLSGMKRSFSRLNANKRLLFEAFKIAHEKGCRFAHLGGGVGGSEEDSLMRFKAGFSPLRGQFHIAKRIHNEKIYNTIIDETWLLNNVSGFFPKYRDPNLR